MTLGRREFLQRLSAALTALGMTDLSLTGYANAYQRALAEGTRCLALLIGINEYAPATWQSAPALDKGWALAGAVTDVELQQELLLNRFGVRTADMVTLTDEQATGAGILAAVQGHLLAQAQPGDTVMLHFSGLGSRVQVAGQPQRPALPTLVAADSGLPTVIAPTLQDVFMENLAQLLSGLKGVKVLTVIDAGGAPQPSAMQGNFRVRSRPVIPTGDWAAPLTSLKEPRQLADELGTTWPGFLLRADAAGRSALEGSWGNFSAGLFTYALTQQLWTTLPAQKQQWFSHRIDRKLAAWTGTDQPAPLQGQQANKEKGLPLLSGRSPQPAADGVIKELDPAGKTAVLWLGGLPAGLLPYGELGLRLQPPPNAISPPQGSVIVKTMVGLRAKAEVLSATALTVGTPLLEVERRLPKDIGLTVALDPTLERIERVDATSALAGMPYITTVSPGERAVDCLFGKVRRSPAPTTGTTPKTPGLETNLGNTDPDQLVTIGHGLFTPDRTLIAGTAAEAEEAVKTAVSRLHGALRSLLAVKMLRLTANPISSRLPLRLTLETQAPSSQVLLVEETLRSRQLTASAADTTERLAFRSLTAKRPEQYQLRLLNSGVVPLYYLLISIVEKSRLSVYCPPLTGTPTSEQTSGVIAEASQLPPGQVITFPRLTENSFSLEPLKATEVFALACTQPFIETWKTMRTPELRLLSDRWSTLPEPLPAARAILTDLSRASQALDADTPPPPDGLLALRSGAWATLSL